MSRMGKFVETKYRLAVPMGWGEREIGRSCLTDKGLYFGVMEMLWN